MAKFCSLVFPIHFVNLDQVLINLKLERLKGKSFSLKTFRQLQRKQKEMRTLQVKVRIRIQWAIPGLFFIFFSSQFKYKLKNAYFCARDSNPVRQDGRHTQIHSTIAASLSNSSLMWVVLRFDQEELNLGRCFSGPAWSMCIS